MSDARNIGCGIVTGLHPAAAGSSVCSSDQPSSIIREQLKATSEYFRRKEKRRRGLFAKGDFSAPEDIVRDVDLTFLPDAMTLRT
jgi:hypothetical protein